MLAKFACNPGSIRGRLYPENPTPYRNEFERDRDRIIHSSAFRRLQYKTQVFVNHEGDHYRNRLTHSLEVSCVARSICKMLGLSEDLAEAVALAHDLGHTPFGHAGENALDSAMKNYGGFSHNAHSLKILTKIEKKYAAYDGVNLTWEVLEGIVKHNGPMNSSADIPEFIRLYNQENDLELEQYSSAEAQVASLSDDITYICHDLEDSIRGEIIELNDLTELEFIYRYVQMINNAYSDLKPSRIIYEVVRKLVHHLIESLLTQTRANIAKEKLDSHLDVRNLGYQLINFTGEVTEEISRVKKFLFNRVYRHHKVTSVTLRCQKIVKDLFNLYMENNDLLPLAWRKQIDNDNIKSAASVVADYIAGMTDRFAIKEYQSFYNLNLNLNRI